VLVPGVPGYVPMRDRQSLTTWARADGSENPDWWEVTGKKDAREEGEAPPRSEVPTLTDEDDFVRHNVPGSGIVQAG